MKGFPSNHLTIPEKDFMRHALIGGTTGSGKTSTASLIASQLSKVGKVVVLDWFGEYSSRLCNYRIYVPGAANPLPLVSGCGEGMIQMFEEVLELTPPQTYILSKAVKGKGLLSSEGLIRAVESVHSGSRWFLESKLALLRKLEALLGSKSGKVFSAVGMNKFLESLSNADGPLVIDLSVFRELIQKRLAALLVLKVVEYLKLKGAVDGDVYVVVEEAHNLGFIGESLLQRLHAEVRKHGIGLLMISQSPSMFPKGVLANVNVKIYHALKLRDDLEAACRSLGEEFRECAPLLTRLHVGEAVVDAPEFPHPFTVKISPPQDPAGCF
ncbi:MAG: ATP-binding protein [Desulfurococcales archaeon]|nr:ATP-binding protein [Desulfurococcales archaeon]